MMTRMNALIRSEEGQGMTEYIIIVALIAIAAVGVITVFGQNLRALFAGSASILGGDKGKVLTSYGSKGSNITTAKKSIGNFAKAAYDESK